MKRKVVLELVRRIIIRNPLKLIFILSFSMFALLLRPYFDLISLLKMSLLLAMLLNSFLCAILSTNCIDCRFFYAVRESV